MLPSAREQKARANKINYELFARVIHTRRNPKIHGVRLLRNSLRWKIRLRTSTVSSRCAIIRACFLRNSSTRFSRFRRSRHPYRYTSVSIKLGCRIKNCRSNLLSFRPASNGGQLNRPFRQNSRRNGVDRWKSVARPPLSRAYLWGARVMSHRKRESLPLRNARHGRKVCASVRACVRACTRRESCVARANADLTYCACACAAESFRRSIEAIARQPHRSPTALILSTTLRASVDGLRASRKRGKRNRDARRSLDGIVRLLISTFDPLESKDLKIVMRDWTMENRCSLVFREI